MDVVAVLRTTTHNQSFRKCFRTRPDFLRLVHDLGNEGYGSDGGCMKIPYSPPEPSIVHRSSGSEPLNHDSAYGSSNGLHTVEYHSDNGDNRNNEYAEEHVLDGTKGRRFNSSEDLLLHINEDVIRNCQKYVDDVQACVSITKQQPCTQKHPKKRRRPRKLPQIPLPTASKVKSATLLTQSPVNTTSLADELHNADVTFLSSPEDDQHHSGVGRLHDPTTYNYLGSPEDIDTANVGAYCSNESSRPEEHPSLRESPQAVKSCDNYSKRTALEENPTVNTPEKAHTLAASNSKIKSQSVDDHSSSPKRCDRITSSLPESVGTEEPPEHCDGDVAVTCSTVKVKDLEVTHRGCHKFIPRHADEIFIQIGDPIYVEAEHEDLWCQGINLRSKQRGIFPAVCATDLSFLESQEAGAVQSSTRYYVKYLGSVEVKHHKGTDVLSHAIHKVALSRRSSLKAKTLPLCCLELNDYGIAMKDRSQLQKDAPGNVDSITQRLARLLSKESGIGEGAKHFFSFKNISFCGCHPQNDSYFAFITKHPLQMKFACHVFLGEDSTKCIADTVGKAFRRFYQQCMAFSHPTEDIYLE